MLENDPCMYMLPKSQKMAMAATILRNQAGAHFKHLKKTSAAVTLYTKTELLAQTEANGTKLAKW